MNGHPQPICAELPFARRGAPLVRYQPPLVSFFARIYTLPRLALIVETVVTTINPDGSVNCGAMGVEWGEQRIVIRP